MKAILLAALLLAGCGGLCGSARQALVVAEERELTQCLDLPTADEAEACAERVGAQYDRAFRALDGDASR